MKWRRGVDGGGGGGVVRENNDWDNTGRDHYRDAQKHSLLQTNRLQTFSKPSHLGCVSSAGVNYFGGGGVQEPDPPACLFRRHGPSSHFCR